MNKHKPMVVVGENVINLERMENGEVLKTIKTDLTNAGYKVEVWKMFAPDYGVPQRRARLFFICVRNDIHEVNGFPEIPKPRFEGKHRSIEWAIGDLVNVTDESIPNRANISVLPARKRAMGKATRATKK